MQKLLLFFIYNVLKYLFAYKFRYMISIINKCELTNFIILLILFQAKKYTYFIFQS